MRVKTNDHTKQGITQVRIFVQETKTHTQVEEPEKSTPKK